MKKIILSVAVLAILFTGCKKKEDNPAPSTTTKTKTEYLTAHSWKISGSVSDVTIDADDNSNTPDTKDLWSQFYDACEKDDVFTFAANGTGTFTDAGTPCTPSNSQDITWTLTNNGVIVVTILGNGSFGLTIVSIDDNTLKLSYPTQQDPNGKDFIVTETFIK